MSRKKAFIHTIPIEELEKPRPGIGMYEVYADCWWSFIPGEGLLFYGDSPQCNTDKYISNKFTKEHFPNAEVRQFPIVFVKHNCQDYS